MIYLRLFYEFLKVGLYSVGGGLATIPFLHDIGTSTGWFDAAKLADMIAISESTPGPIGVNMATYVGFHCGGVPGAIVATLGLVTPSIIVILIVARMLKAFRQNQKVEKIFEGLRPASVALITSAGIGVALSTWFPSGTINWPSIALGTAVFVAMNYTPLKKLHPLAFLAFSAVVGIVFGL